MFVLQWIGDQIGFTPLRNVQALVISGANRSFAGPIKLENNLAPKKAISRQGTMSGGPAQANALNAIRSRV
jgi:hypothetical protein